MSLLITGTNGMLGSCLSKTFREADTISGRSELDLTDLKKTNKWLQNKFYSVIIHSAAFTDMKFCEQNREKSEILHGKVIEILNKYCKKLVYISTVPVWERPSYSESAYFESKRFGELITLSDKNNFVIRTNIYGRSNLVHWAYSNLVNLKKINGFCNSYFNPVHVKQLSLSIKNILNKKTNQQIYTISGNKIISKYRFLKEVAKSLNLDSSLVLSHKLDKVQDLVLESPDEVYSFKEGMEFIKDDYRN